MPIYEYRCDACNQQFELRQKFSDPPADSCPKCKGTVHKIVSAAAFSLKGGGWYAEGYETKSEDAKSETDTAAVTETAPESAPADSASKETTASPAATPAPVASQPETRGTVAEKPAAPSTEKTSRNNEVLT